MIWGFELGTPTPKPRHIDPLITIAYVFNTNQLITSTFE